MSSKRKTPRHRLLLSVWVEVDGDLSVPDQAAAMRHRLELLRAGLREANLTAADSFGSNIAIGRSTSAVEATYQLDRLAVCRECGCTDVHACEGGCAWVEEDLCSRCAPPNHPAFAPKSRPKSRRKR